MNYLIVCVCSSLTSSNIFIHLAFISFIGALLIIIQFLPIILDVILPLDEPRPRRLLVTVEYFTTEINDKYFYIKVFHEVINVTIYVSMLFAMVTQLLAFACHIFGMFKIAR